MDFKKLGLIKVIKWVLVSIFIPIAIAFFVGYYFWFSTKDNVEVTLKLEGWITIETFKSNILPDLKLMYKGEIFDYLNITKVEWCIRNTGNKGINSFEIFPTLEVPKEFDVLSATVVEKSQNLKIKKELIISDNIIKVDSLGIFNSGDYFIINVFLINVIEKDLTRKFFENWEFICKSVDLSVAKDITIKEQEKEFNWDFIIILLAVIAYSILIVTYYRRHRRNKRIKKRESYIRFLEKNIINYRDKLKKTKDKLKKTKDK